MTLDDEVATFYVALKDFQSRLDDADARVAFAMDVERAARALASLEHVGQASHHPHAFMTRMQWRRYVVLDVVRRQRLNAQLTAINPTNIKALVCAFRSNGLLMHPDEDACLYLALKDGLSKINTHASDFLLVGIKKAIRSFASLGQTAITSGVVEADYELQREIRAFVEVDNMVRTSMNAMLNNNESTQFDARVAATIGEFVNVDKLGLLFCADTFRDLRRHVLNLPDALKEYRNTTLANIDRTKKRRGFDTLRSVVCSTLLSEIRDLVASTMYVRAVAL